jgi:hypothetical protein
MTKKILTAEQRADQASDAEKARLEEIERHRMLVERTKRLRALRLAAAAPQTEAPASRMVQGRKRVARTKT